MLNYHVMPSIHLDDIKDNCTQDDIIKLLKGDALIVSVSGHGIENHIITSE